LVKSGCLNYTIQNSLFATVGATLVAIWLHKKREIILISSLWLIEVLKMPLFSGFLAFLPETVLQQ